MWFINKLKEKKNTVAIIGKDIVSYNELYYLIIDYYGRIKRKIDSGVVVSIVSDYSVESIALFFALYLNRNIISITTNESNIHKNIEDGGIEYLVRLCDDGKLLINHVGENDNSKVAEFKKLGRAGLILFTSGTTGTPKVLLHDLKLLFERFKDRPQHSSIMLLFLMFDHMGGINTLLASLFSGNTIVLAKDRDVSNICKLIEKYKISVLPSSPTFLNMIIIGDLHKRYDLSSLKLITYGTEIMNPSLLNTLKKEFVGVKFHQTYGLSEMGVCKVKSKEDTFISLEDYKIIDNVLWLKSQPSFIGYLNTDDSIIIDGWINTGDVVEATEDSFRIIGRVNDVINVGGMKVFPSEVESVLMEIPQIIDCVVYSEKNNLIGEVVLAKVVTKDDFTNLEAKILVSEHCKGRLDKYKIPVKVFVVENLPYTARFKKKR
jgi:acyl-coenzyme A synthetase/AMP-(fatty) acid ligase